MSNDWLSQCPHRKLKFATHNSKATPGSSARPHVRDSCTRNRSAKRDNLTTVRIKSAVGANGAGPSFRLRYKFRQQFSCRPAKAGKLGEVIPSARHFRILKRRSTMHRDLRGLRMIITGASSGIGKCLAEQATERGGQVALTARSADALHALAEELTERGGRAIAIPADITSEEDRVHLLDTVVEQFGGLDVLINNAGVAGF